LWKLILSNLGFRSLRARGITDDGGVPWVKGIEGQSGLLRTVVPLSRPERGNSQKWSNKARRLLTSTNGNSLGEDAIFQTVPESERETGRIAGG
jgi:hypothetical protein